MKTLEDASVLPWLIAERYPFSEKLNANFERLVARPTFGKMFWKAERQGRSREFCAMFFDHWTLSLAGWMSGSGRKPVWF